MTVHGTASDTVRGTFVEFSAAVLRALPRDLDPDTELSWVNNGEGLSRILREGLAPKTPTAAVPTPTPPAPTPVPTAPSVPAIGEEFELTLERGNRDPLGMVQDFGYDRKGWKHDGPTASGPQTRRFKLVEVGYQPNLDGVRTACASHGTVPEGQWLEAFKAAYPTPEGRPVGIADPSWVDPAGHRDFPSLLDDGERWVPGFYVAGHAHDDRWLWLVACE